MTILIINFEYPPLGGGGGVATQLFAQELAHRHVVHVITTHRRGLPRREEVGSLVIHRLSVLGRTSVPTASLLSLITFVPVAVWRGWKLGRSIRPDVINAQFVLPSGVVGMILAYLLRTSLVVSFIGGDLFDPSKSTSPHRHAILRWLIRFVAARAEQLTAISEDTKRHARNLHGVTAPITVTHLGVKPLSAPPASRSSLQLPADAPVFITIGRLIPRKNYPVLLEAWTQVPDAHLVILGDGPLKEQLSATISRLNLTDRVQLRGFVDEVTKQQLLMVADGYISSSDHEGFGIVFLEAMDAGLPIVAAARGGHTDFLQSEANALLVTPGDATQLAQAVQRLSRDADFARRMGLRNKEVVREFYLDGVTRGFETILLEAKHTYARSL